MLASGALLASMSARFLVLKGAGAPLIDFVGKAVLNAIATLGLIHLGMRFRRDPSDGRGAGIEETGYPALKGPGGIP
jgi:hypothetical protein